MLARSLAERGHNATIIEVNRTRIATLKAALSDHTEIKIALGDGASSHVLEEMGISSADLVVISTGSGALTSFIAQKVMVIFKKKRIVAAIRSFRLQSILQERGIKAVNTLESSISNLLSEVETVFKNTKSTEGQ